MKIVCATFDVDQTDYLNNNNNIDEFERAFGQIQYYLNSYPIVKTTWFVRIDKQQSELRNDPKYIFNKHFDKLNWLKNNGHEIGWHHHAYKKDRNNWAIVDNENELLEQININGTIARSLGINSSRMGWGQQTLNSLNLLENLGFIIDSSAMPRPNYNWENVPLRDWSGLDNVPYFPDKNNYLKKAAKQRKIIEIPISVTKISAYSDTVPNMKRYINPAYKPEVFKKAVDEYKDDIMVMTCHPYEVLPNDHRHHLIDFSPTTFKRNIEFLLEKNFHFLTIHDLRNQFI